MVAAALLAASVHAQEVQPLDGIAAVVDEDGRPPDVADTLQATVVRGVGLPASDTADV